MNTIHEEEVKWLELPGRRCRVIVGSDYFKAENLTFGVTEIPPCSKMIPHKHSQEEVIYILQGKGEVVVDTKSEPLKPGTTIMLPANCEHFICNTSNQTMKFTFAFSPQVTIGSYDKKG